jgi:hypothetical protein
VLIWLRLRRSHARTMGARAAEYVRECHSASRVAELYGQCFVD